MFAIAQTADGFLWFGSQSYRHLPVRRHQVCAAAAVQIQADRQEPRRRPEWGYVALTTRGVTHVKGESVASDFEPSGVIPHGSMSVDTDGSLWVVRDENTVSDAPFCHATDQAVKCFGKADGVSIWQRAAVMGGRLTVRSEPDAGTEVDLRVPRAIAYATSLQQGPVSVKRHLIGAAAYAADADIPARSRELVTAVRPRRRSAWSAVRSSGASGTSPHAAAG